MSFPRSVAFVSVVFVASFGAASLAPARAADEHVYVIANNDGYGVTDCLAQGGGCGKIVADAWCEAHGNGEALQFGPQSGGAGVSKISTDAESYYVTCAN